MLSNGFSVTGVRRCRGCPVRRGAFRRSLWHRRWRRLRFIRAELWPAPEKDVGHGDAYDGGGSAGNADAFTPGSVRPASQGGRDQGRQAAAERSAAIPCIGPGRLEPPSRRRGHMARPARHAPGHVAEPAVRHPSSRRRREQPAVARRAWTRRSPQEAPGVWAFRRVPFLRHTAESHVKPAARTDRGPSGARRSRQRQSVRTDPGSRPT
jgi:hypothetical protein